MTSRTARRRVLRVPCRPGRMAGPADPRADLLAVEEPLEIRVGGQPLAVTMRTPGHDIDLAAGFLATEGVIGSAADLSQIKMCDANVADVTLAPGAGAARERLRRNFVTTSACGVCGKESIDAIRVQARYDVSADQVRVAPRRWPRCRAGCARPSGSSPAPAGCTQRESSGHRQPAGPAGGRGQAQRRG